MTTPITGAAGVGIEGARAAIRSVATSLGVDPGIDPGTVTGSPSFADTLGDALGDMNEIQDGARDAISAFLRGDDIELHEVMAATEEAGIALELLIEVRNKIVDAYRTLSSMQG